MCGESMTSCTVSSDAGALLQRGDDLRGLAAQVVGDGGRPERRVDVERQLIEAVAAAASRTQPIFSSVAAQVNDRGSGAAAAQDPRRETRRSAPHGRQAPASSGRRRR